MSWEGLDLGYGVIDLPSSAASIHGSLYLLPALVSTGRPVRFDGFGGCQIGNGPGGERPWRHVVDVMYRFGAHFEESAAGLILHAPNGFGEADIDLLDYAVDRNTRSGPEYSGATKAAVLAAALGQGRSTPPELLGRVNAAARVAIMCTLPIGAVGFGALASGIGLRQTFLVIAVGLLVVAVHSHRRMRMITTTP